MTNAEFYRKLQPLLDEVSVSDDALFFCHFSRDVDTYHAKPINMDGGDALILTEALVRSFRLEPSAVAAAISDIEGD